jgi:hypothetical protein
MADKTIRQKLPNPACSGGGVPGPASPLVVTPPRTTEVGG